MGNQAEPSPSLDVDRPHEPAPPVIAASPEGRNLGGPADRFLTVRAAEGDDEAFAVLVRRHSSVLLGLALHLLGNRADAEDAVQDAFLSAWRRLPEFHHSASFGTWMYRIVTNRCLNTLRRGPRALPLDAVAEPTAGDPGSSPPRAAETHAAMAALVAALRELNPDQRACWVLRELHGLHYEEIAHATGTSEQTVRGRLFRARHALQEAMRPWR
ncbi:sigma-70 family RNA polymerase sigma factor [Streptomyces sp. NA04227]|uniref:RNA polymerase sigma factor n=1 Tax=Streptomyces sp. NA04227 TaxID=2742136 RepID=UPI001590583B|nr:sigma-70 family RNA polymerase sigma factor [Streptomyces sp. NA04227]QKW09985.1 sigma-70 family RNA polymerase sigma factor [Streptomyces sp. NA04227]